jgi:nucleoside 2-deoxyribosyltransferase
MGEIQRVYLSGPMTGFSFNDANNWRVYLTQLLEAIPNIKCISPTRSLEFLEHKKQEYIDQNIWDSEENIITSASFASHRDYHDIVSSNLVFVNLFDELKKGKVSIGTMIEVGIAFALKKPIILLMEENNHHNHPLLMGYASVNIKYDTLKNLKSNLFKAADIITAFLLV